MKCEHAMKKFLELDNNGTLPLTLQIHLLTCKDCRDEVKKLQSAYLSLKDNPPYITSLTDTIMAQISLQKQYYQKVSNFNWLAAGFIIFLSIGLISYSDTFEWLSMHFGTKITIPIYLVLGCIISGYIGSYVASHMKKLVAIAHSIKSLRQ